MDQGQLSGEIHAGFWVRLMAHNIDLVILLPLFYLLSFLISVDTLLYISCFILTLIYEAGFVASKWHGTPGKKTLNLQVVSAGNRSLGWPRIIIRTLGKIVTIATLFIGYGVIIFHPEKRGLHDLIAGSKVILISE